MYEIMINFYSSEYYFSETDKKYYKIKIKESVLFLILKFTFT